MYLLVASSPPSEISTTIFDSRRIAIYSQSEEEILFRLLPFKILARIDFFRSSHEQRGNLFSLLRGRAVVNLAFLNYLNRDKSSVVVRLSQKSALHAHALLGWKRPAFNRGFLVSSSLCFSFSFFPRKPSVRENAIKRITMAEDNKESRWRWRFNQLIPILLSSLRSRQLSRIIGRATSILRISLNTTWNKRKGIFLEFYFIDIFSPSLNKCRCIFLRKILKILEYWKGSFEKERQRQFC